LLTAAAVFAPYGNAPLSNRAAWRVYRALAADDRTQLAAEPSELQDVWEGYAERDTASPKLWTDAYLAAFARTGGHRLVTTDQDYGQFPDLDVLVL
jgi:predicted nucleic acid-binding protein